MKLATPLSLGIQLGVVAAQLAGDQTLTSSHSFSFPTEFGVGPVSSVSTEIPGPTTGGPVATVRVTTTVPVPISTITVPSAAPSSNAISISTSPSFSSTIGETASSAVSTGEVIIPSPTSLATDGPANTPVVADTTAVVKRPGLPKPAVIGIALGAILLAVVAAVIFWLLRRPRSKSGHSSRIVLDAEAAPAAKQMSSTGANTSPLSYSAGEDQNVCQSQRLAQLEHQTRALQQEIDALRGSSLNRSESESSTGYSVNAGQKQKFDSLAARAGNLRVYREPDPVEDVPPEYAFSSGN
ncbi:hypothetical protein B0H14DRAFT_2831432 [Mycena olivaceomarginata]|nr:hypothetical protein B0H14DRAFT_2831432 [Mycena olivaceomarginata]